MSLQKNIRDLILFYVKTNYNQYLDDRKLKYIPDNEIERMLNIQYDESFLERSFRAKDTVLLRKDDGEHEYRFFEWENFFKISGFNIVENFLIKTETENNKNSCYR